jgi:23S rRNA pseudouridine2604 synthase
MKYDESSSRKSSSGTGRSRNPGGKSPSRSIGTKPQEVSKREEIIDGVRLNKCLGGLSRRGADDAISEGRVTINNEVASNGRKVKKRDVVRLDGKIQHWEGVAEAKKVAPSLILEDRSFIYVKYWKTTGVTCTSDLGDKSNIIKAGSFDLFPQRLFTVGRLDKDSSGLILLTSDGRVNEAMLSPQTKKEKVYNVEFDRTPTDAQITSLCQGVLITTIAQRDSRTGSSGSKSAKPLTAKTRPCKVFRIGGPQSKKVEFTLTEGRNRQIRKMAEAIGLTVTKLHRTTFGGIGLKGLSEGNWSEFTEKEMEIIQSALKAHRKSKEIDDSDITDEEFE